MHIYCAVCKRAKSAFRAWVCTLLILCPLFPHPLPFLYRPAQVRDQSQQQQDPKPRHALILTSSYVDTNKGFSLVRTAQAHYARTSATTQVLPASLTSVAEVMQLAGAHHITISPPLLAELAATPAAAPSLVAKKLWMDAAGDGANAGADAVYASLVADEAAYRMAFTRSAGGENERKLSDAINIFADMQDAMEALVRPLLYT